MMRVNLLGGNIKGKDAHSLIMSLVIIMANLLIMLPSSPLLAEMPPLKDIMSETELEQTGLSKLSEDEIQALQEWLEVFIERDATSIIRSYRKEQQFNKQNQGKVTSSISENISSSRGEDDTASNQQTDAIRENRYAVIESHIVGEFRGWTAHSRFVLANGQVWKNRRKGSQRHIRPVTDPKVIIDKNLFGKYVMKLPDVGVSIQVRRVK